MLSKEWKYVALFLLLFFMMACGDKQPDKQVSQRDLTVVFATISGMTGDGYNELILQGVMESVKVHPDISLHLLKPDSIGEARRQIEAWNKNADPTKTLLLCGPEFEPVVAEIDSTPGRILLLDSDHSFGKGVSTALLKRYGGGWLAGAMIHELRMLLIKGLNGDRIIDAISSGIEDGYRENEGRLDDYQYLVDGLMRFDSVGNITGYMVGDNLNAANPLEISVPVADYEEAVSTFRDLLPQESVLKQEGTTYTWTMKDSLGNTIGDAILEPSTEEGCIATMYIKKGPKIDPAPARRLPAALPGNPKCLFIPESAWPENSGAADEKLENEYYLGAVVEKTKDEGFGKGKFLVIQPWTSKESGLMIKLENEDYNDSNVPSGKCSSANTLHRVYRELHKNNNYQEIYEAVGVAQLGWPTLEWFYLTKTKKNGGKIMVRLSDDNEKVYNTDGKRYIDKKPARKQAASTSLHMAYCYCFKPNGDKIKFW